MNGGDELQLHRWLTGPVVSVAALVAAAGFGQFGAVAALGDVASHFGDVEPGDTIGEQAGLSGTAVGVGLAVIRLASLGSLPLAALADRVGRRQTLTWWCAAGLLLTAAAALSPSYWAFVALFALSRPFLTATDTVGEVTVAEHTAAADRAKAIALVAAAYGVGAGLIAIVRGLGEDALGFRAVFALALVPLAAVPLLARRLREPDRYRAAGAAEDKPLPVLGAVGRPFRGRLAVLVAVIFAVAVVTGPANSFVFLYGENVLGVSATTMALLVVAGAPAGLAGLLVGRWAADSAGRRVTGGVALAFVAVAGIVAYSGGATALAVGYLGAIAAGSLFAPAIGALAAELFPTEVRAAVAGWLVAFGVLGAVAGLLLFGAIADANEEFATASRLVFAPAGLLAMALALLPETRGRELEDWEAAST